MPGGSLPHVLFICYSRLLDHVELRDAPSKRWFQAERLSQLAASSMSSQALNELKQGSRTRESPSSVWVMKGTGGVVTAVRCCYEGLE